MASLKYSANANFQIGTLASSYTSGGVSLVLTAGHGARFPSSGDFWVRVEDEVFKCTSRSTDTLTVVGAQDGTSASNHASSSEVRWVLGVAGLDQMRTDISGAGTYANLPAAGTITGDLYFFTDSPYTHARWNGSSWDHFAGGHLMTIPVFGDFAWVNQGSATATTTYGGVIIYAPEGASDSLRILKKAAPATPYTIEGAFTIPTMPVVNYNAGGLLFRNSAALTLASSGFGTNFAAIPYYFSAAVNKWTNPTTYSAAYLSVGIPVPSLLWFQISDNGTSRISRWSADGINWMHLHTVGRTDFLTADEIGFFANANNATYPAFVHLLHWKQT